MGSRTILIVDDDNDVRRALTDLLEDEGYVVAGASNGRVALDLVRSGLRPALILLDLMMPGMNGWDFREAQLRDPDLCTVPVVVISASGFNRDVIRNDLGEIEIVAKPIQPNHLLDVIERLLAAPRARAQACQVRSRRPMGLAILSVMPPDLGPAKSPDAGTPKRMR